MRRIALVVIAILAGTSAFADDQILLLRMGESAVIDLGEAGQFPVLPAVDGLPPEDCPEGAFWVDGIGIGAVLNECGGDAQYEIVESSAPGSWTLFPWPRPIDGDDWGPRAR